MDTSRMSGKENKKGKVHVISAEGELKFKMMKYVVVMAEHSYTPIVGRADMLKTQSDIKECASSTLETPQQMISGAAADLGEEVANMMHTLHSIWRYIRRVRKKLTSRTRCQQTAKPWRI